MVNKLKLNAQSLGEAPCGQLLEELIRCHWPTPPVKISPVGEGFSHWNYQFVDHQGRKVFLRVSAKLKNHFLTEVELLKSLRSQVLVPGVLEVLTDIAELQGGHLAFMEFIEGVPLCTVEDDLSDGEIRQIALQIGEALAAVHSIQYDRGGFLGPDQKVQEPFKDDCVCDFLHFIRRALHHPKVQRELTSPEIKNLESFVQQTSAVLDDLQSLTHLVHGDFNSSNILVQNVRGTWRLQGICDWEYAFSGAPWVDFGNFFREPYVRKLNYEAPLSAAYRSCGGFLPLEQWRQGARLFDLVSLLQFLLREEARPQTLSAVKEILRRSYTL